MATAWKLQLPGCAGVGFSHARLWTLTDLSQVPEAREDPPSRGCGLAAAPPVHPQVIARLWAGSSPPPLLGQVAFPSSAFTVRANVLSLSLSLVCH